MDQTILVVELTVSGETDILVFHFPEEETLSVNLNSSESQSDFKKVFSKLLQLILDGEVVLNFEKAEGYSKNLYIDVCKEYIEALNQELVQVRKSIIENI